jgi:hypothetical protein
MLGSALSVFVLMLVSCASSPEATTTATHQTTVTRESSPRLTQAPGGTGYMDNNIGSGDWGADPGEHF